VKINFICFKERKLILINLNQGRGITGSKQEQLGLYGTISALA
jgi:hypothetical protein